MYAGFNLNISQRLIPDIDFSQYRTRGKRILQHKKTLLGVI